MVYLDKSSEFNIEITKSIIGLNFCQKGKKHRVIATFLGRNDKECVVTEPVYVNDMNVGSHWIHSDYYKRVEVY